MNTVRALYDRTLTEKTWQADVLRLAAQLGWHAYHQYDSRRSHEGWPDLVLLKPPRALFLELKAETGKLSHAQQQTLDLLRACGLRADVVRPHDRAILVDVLMGKAA